jgi:hypothetical protein
LRYRFGACEAAVGVPGEFSLIPYAGVILDKHGIIEQGKIVVNYHISMALK